MDSETDQAQVGTETETKKRQFDKNSFGGTLLVAIVLCVVCSLVVSATAVGLRPLQKANQENKRKRNVLIAAGLWQEDYDDSKIDELFESIKVVPIQLPERGDDAATNVGEVDSEIVAESFDPVRAAKDPQASIEIGEQDLADIGRRAKHSIAYEVYDNGKLDAIVLPIYGKGLWSTLYGFIALEADGRTVRGITFYQHGETPGLGGEVDNPTWKAQWPGKVVLDTDGKPVIEVTKPGNATDDNQVDGLSGATITSSGVEKTVRYWLGEDAFGPYLDRIRASEVAAAQ